MAAFGSDTRDFLGKARQNAAAAHAEFVAGRYDACANRAYYACFHAAVAALLSETIRPSGSTGQWSHEFVHAQFAGVLIQRRKRYPADLRRILPENQLLRERADYRPEPVAEQPAARALRRMGVFVRAIEEQMR